MLSENDPILYHFYKRFAKKWADSYGGDPYFAKTIENCLIKNMKFNVYACSHPASIIKLGHYEVDAGSCFRFDGERCFDKFNVLSSKNTFVLIFDSPVNKLLTEDMVGTDEFWSMCFPGRCFGQITKDGVILTNFYTKKPSCTYMLAAIEWMKMMFPGEKYKIHHHAMPIGRTPKKNVYFNGDDISISSNGPVKFDVNAWFDVADYDEYSGYFEENEDEEDDDGEWEDDGN